MAVVSDPTYPVVGDNVTFTLTSSSGTAIVLEVTSVPSASSQYVGLQMAGDLADADVLDISRDASWIIENDHVSNGFSPDVPGEYGIRIYDFIEVLGIPSYDGDPAGPHRFTLAGSQTGTLHVGEAVSLPIRMEDQRGADLEIDIVNETVRAAELANFSDEWARIASLDTAVATALTNLVGVAVNSIGNDLATDVNNLRTEYELHRVNNGGAYHANNDTVNTVLRTSANSTEGALALLAALYDAIVAHCRNSTQSATRWHTGGAGVPADDLKNLPIAALATTLGGATVLCADLRERCYERHRVQVAAPASHGAADATNDLTAPTVLDNVIVAYLDALATIAPAAPAGEPEGIVDARHRYGFS